jgi:uncharacterized protein (DUF983 family)
MSNRLTPMLRGAAGRCANCGGRGVFASFSELHPRCPSCGYLFEREEGYWLGAMIANICVTEALFGIWFVGGMLATWPDVPWMLLLIGGVALNIVVPIVYYPISKTQWVGIHLAFARPDPTEEAGAIAAQAASAHEGTAPDVPAPNDAAG